MTRARFIGQPHEGELPTGERLAAALDAEGHNRFTAVVAWARFGGLKRMEAQLNAFRERGGTSRVFLGIDEGVATRPGLVLAHRLFTEAFVVHDRPGITFHPKFFLAEGQ